MTVCHQYGLHCSHGLFIGLPRMDRLHRKRRTRGRRPPILSGVAASARDKRCALMEKDLRRRRAGGAGNHSVPIARRRNGRTGTAIHAQFW